MLSKGASGAKKTRFASHWWRIVAAVAAGVVALVSSAGRLKPSGAAALFAWDMGALVYLAALAFLFFTNTEPLVRARAQQEDESRALLMSLILLAIGACLGAIVLTLRNAQSAGKAGLPVWLVVLATVSLVLGWLLVQALFTLHYAHRYFADRDSDGHADGGVKFPGDPPTSYRDFLYMAVCIGATCQVSDFDITSRRFRNLVTAHALIAFGFNTMVLALGINMIAGLIGGH